MGGRHRGEGENLAHCLVSGGGGGTRLSSIGSRQRDSTSSELGSFSDQAEVTGHSACSSQCSAHVHHVIPYTNDK